MTLIEETTAHDNARSSIYWYIRRIFSIVLEAIDYCLCQSVYILYIYYIYYILYIIIYYIVLDFTKYDRSHWYSLSIGHRMSIIKSFMSIFIVWPLSGNMKILDNSIFSLNTKFLLNNLLSTYFNCQLNSFFNLGYPPLSPHSMALSWSRVTKLSSAAGKLSLAGWPNYPQLQVNYPLQGYQTILSCR